MASLQDLAREMNAGLDPADPPSKRALQIARELARERPDTTSRGRQRAAAAASGAPAPLTDREMDAEIADPSTRGKQARGVAESAATRTGKAARRALRPVSPVKSATSVKGLMLQAVSLTALYWLVRTPEAVATAASGVTSAFRWLASTRGVPGR